MLVREQVRYRENETKFARRSKEKNATGRTGRNIVCDPGGDAKFDFKNESRCDIIVSKIRDSSVFQSGYLRL